MASNHVEKFLETGDIHFIYQCTVEELEEVAECYEVELKAKQKEGMQRELVRKLRPKGVLASLETSEKVRLRAMDIRLQKEFYKIAQVRLELKKLEARSGRGPAEREVNCMSASQRRKYLEWRIPLESKRRVAAEAKLKTMLEERKSKDNDNSDNAEDCKKEAKESGDENKEQQEKRKEVDHRRRKQKHMEEKEIVTNDASKQKEASNTEEVKQLVDKSNAEEETTEKAEKETTENAEKETTENAEEKSTENAEEETTEEEEKEKNEKKKEDVEEYREMEEKNREKIEEYEMGLNTLFEEVESDIEGRPTKISGTDCEAEVLSDFVVEKEDLKKDEDSDAEKEEVQEKIQNEFFEGSDNEDEELEAIRDIFSCDIDYGEFEHYEYCEECADEEEKEDYDGEEKNNNDEEIQAL
ncbi:hypothetical protein Pcinc_000914 [Petrolisthes cinctipes]|uniref:Uncharacterized protein n=1 Tax=Petrolisthes cinctipes TaxID=88211 RepID=A0AAE1GRS6_PETCI|nr:hypothetical protein Pcinc_000914 [Petrolisthes cinctipes]